MTAVDMDDPLQIDDTIAALAAAPGPAVRGIVRVSGDDVHRVLTRLFHPDDEAAWLSPRRAARHPGAMTLPELHLPLRVDVLLWPTTRSYTGQPLAEVHTVGSPPLLEGILSALFAEGVRPARRGEFTLRAFLAGRIDLLQAEAVLGVIDASDQQQLDVALGQLGGGLSNRIADLHEHLLLHLADLEAGLDFVEEDIEFVSRDELSRRLAEGEAFLQRLVDQSQQRLQSTGRRKVVLAGLPNAGKSTLFNALVGDPRAIVSHVAGTTRDYLSAPLSWDGLAIELIDTAGWDSLSQGTPDNRDQKYAEGDVPVSRRDGRVQTIEDGSAGINRSADEQRQQQWDRSDLVVWCSARDLPPEERQQDAALRQAFPKHHRPLVVTTKGDCGPTPEAPGGRIRSEATGGRVRSEANGPAHPEHACIVSSTTGEGLDVLRAAIRQRLHSQAADSAVLGSTAARCRESLGGALAALRQARQAAAAGLGDELIALELREAIDHLGKIAGRVYTDDVLDRIFSRFCIGK